MTDTQRIQDKIDRLAMDLPRRLPPDLRQIFLVNYPDGKYGQLIEANYLAAWDAFATRMETGGFFEMIRHAAVRPLPDNARPVCLESKFRAMQKQIERQQAASLSRLRDAAVLIIEACDQIAAEGRVH